jgi:hypothetical protein
MRVFAGVKLKTLNVNYIFLNEPRAAIKGMVFLDALTDRKPAYEFVSHFITSILILGRYQASTLALSDKINQI